MERRLRRIPRFSRDWRIRTIVPVVLVNVLAFIGLYALMYHWAISNLVQTRKLTADILFDEIIFDFGQGRGAASVLSRLERHARAHQLVSVNVLPATGPASMPLRWNLEPDDRVVFTRGIRNEALCQTCHGTAKPTLAVMQLGFDMTQPIAEARSRVRKRFAIAGLAWLGVLAVIFWTARKVIGRPIAELEKALGGKRDLDALADRVPRDMARAQQLATLGQVAAGLTHEIKNPLAGVIAALEFQRSESKEDDELVEQMLSELRRVTNTVDGLLRLAKPLPPQRTAVDMVRVVREVTSLFAARARRGGIALHVETPDHVPELQLDPSLIVQVLVNLLTNAVQATDRGGTVTISVETAALGRRRTPGAGARPHTEAVTIEVADTGKGIDAAQLPHVFDPFFTTKEEGTGLGLPICRQIVEQHGGTIEIQSKPGQGTRVRVALPEEVRHGAVAAG